MRDVLIDPQVKARQSYPKVVHPNYPGNEDMGAQRYPDIAWKSTFRPTQKLKAAPRLGEHNYDILHRMLGLSEQEINRLKDKEIIGTKPKNADVIALTRTSDEISLMLGEGIIREYDPNYKTIIGSDDVY
jgi:hypothetical protein